MKPPAAARGGRDGRSPLDPPPIHTGKATSLKISKAIGATAALGLLAAGFVAAPAQAADVQSVTTTVKNHADDGHGSPSHWADDTWTRKSTITPGDTDGTYTVHLTGTGSFTTVKDAGAPNGSGTTVGAAVTGDFAEDLTATVTGTPKSAAQLARIDGNTYDDANGVTYTTTEWIKHLFTSASTPTIGNETYRYEYTRPCESWVDADDNNDGQAEDAGNITGKDCTPTTPPFVKSVLNVAAKCRYSKTDKREAWNVSNVAGGRTRTFWLHVSYNGKTTYEGEHTVAAGDTNPVTTAHGGKLKLGYYDGAAHHIVKYAWSNAKVLCK